MAIDRVHWKVGDWVLVSSKGFNQIEAIDDEGVFFTVNRSPETRVGTLHKFPYEVCHFKGVAESKNWKRGSLVYVDGIHPTVIDYITHEKWGCVKYVEWNGDWDSATGAQLTATPLDPKLVEKAKKRDHRLAFEMLASDIASLIPSCPDGTKQWLSNVLKSFEIEFEEQLRGELND